MAKTGIWNKPGEKPLPGIYNRFVSVANEYGENLVGAVGITVKANWGPVNEVVTVKNDINEFISTFGDDVQEKYTAFRIASLMLKTNVKYLKVLRLADESAKKSTVNLKNTNGSSTEIIKLTSKYPTSKNLNVTIKKNVANQKVTEMYIYEDSKLLARIFNIKGTVDEMVDTINNSYENKYIVAEKVKESTDPLAEVSNKKLEGGNDGCSSINNKVYTDSLDKFDREKIDGFCLDGNEDDALDASVFSWILGNYENGRTILYFNGIGKSQDITEGFQKAKKINNQLYTLVGSAGVIDQVQYTPAETACYLCALEVSNNLNESSCNKKTAFTSIKKVLTKAELEEAYKVGVLTLDMDDRDVIVVDDVNTYKTFPDGNKKERAFAYNRSVRTKAAINRMLTSSGKGIVGKVDNDPEIGYDIILSAFKKGFESLVTKGAIKEFHISIDKALQEKAESDELYIMWDVTRTDKVKKIYSSGIVI